MYCGLTGAVHHCLLPSQAFFLHILYLSLLTSSINLNLSLPLPDWPFTVPWTTVVGIPYPLIIYYIQSPFVFIIVSKSVLFCFHCLLIALLLCQSILFFSFFSYISKYLILSSSLSSPKSRLHMRTTEQSTQSTYQSVSYLLIHGTEK